MVSAVTTGNVYEIPHLFHGQEVDKIIVDQLRLKAMETDLSEWDDVIDRSRNVKDEVVIALVGKYLDIADSYKSLTEALTHAGIRTRTKVTVELVDAEEVAREGVRLLDKADAIIVPRRFWQARHRWENTCGAVCS